MQHYIELFSAYTLAIWVVISLIRNLGLFIVYATKNKASEKWFVRYIAKPIDFCMPFIQLLPHSTLPVCKILAMIGKIVPFLEKYLPTAKADEIEKKIEEETEKEK